MEAYMKHVAEHKAASYALIDAMVEHKKNICTVGELLSNAGMPEEEEEDSIDDLSERFGINAESDVSEFLLIVSHHGNVHDCFVPIKSALLLEKYLLGVYLACKEKSDKTGQLAGAEVSAVT